MIYPQIVCILKLISSTQISGNSKTIIDNVFSNIAQPLIKNAATANNIY